MLTRILVIARKELLDGVRDVRSLVSSILYSLMGPGVILMVSLAFAGKPAANTQLVLAGMTAVFVLVSAFVGGVNIAIDTLSGERERRSLLPLLMNGVSRSEVVAGKWIAISAFSVASLVLGLIGFALVGVTGWQSIVVLSFALMPLAMLAGALELAVSTTCRSMKEAHTYLSMLIFLPMGAGMFLVFFPKAANGWLSWIPVAGHYWQLDRWLRAGDLPFAHALVLGGISVVLASAAMVWTAHLLNRDDVVYGS